MIDNWVFLALGMFLMWVLMLLWRTPTSNLKRENWLLKRENDQLKITLESQEIIHLGRKIYLENTVGKWDRHESAIRKPPKEDGVLSFGYDENELNTLEYGEDDYKEL